ncbi:MAG: hypothetical protein IT567_01375 [Alphaproteobacteria bacterium]|nr:hypothetical protein [Alphaproteobacteria bacterium]
MRSEASSYVTPAVAKYFGGTYPEVMGVYDEFLGDIARHYNVTDITLHDMSSLGETLYVAGEISHSEYELMTMKAKLLHYADIVHGLVGNLLTEGSRCHDFLTLWRNIYLLQKKGGGSESTIKQMGNIVRVLEKLTASRIALVA